MNIVTEPTKGQGVDPETTAVTKIASVFHTSRFICDVWSEIPEETRTSIVRHWEQLVRQDPSNGVHLIQEDIRKRPDLHEAWNKMTQDEREARVRIFDCIINEMPKTAAKNAVSQ